MLVEIASEVYLVVNFGFGYINPRVLVDVRKDFVGEIFFPISADSD